MLLGIIIGPPLLGWIDPGDELHLIGQLGVVLLLGMAGMHLGLGQLVREGWSAFWVAVLGMLFCLAGGYVFAVWWGSSLEEAVYIGATLTATSIGISVQVLHQLGLVDHKVGRIVVAAAVIDDVLALYLLAIAHGALGAGLAPAGLFASLLLAALVLAAVYAVCRFLARQSATNTLVDSNTLSVAVVVIIITGFGWLTETLGYSLVVGGFFAGLGLGDGLRRIHRKRLVRHLDGIVLLLVPFFFVSVGSKVEWGVLTDQGMPVLVIGLLVIAILGKITGGVIGAWKAGGPWMRLLVGASMAPRGEVALIIAGLGIAQGHISHHVLVALILMTVGAALVAPLLMTGLSRRLE